MRELDYFPKPLPVKKVKGKLVRLTGHSNYPSGIILSAKKGLMFIAEFEIVRAKGEKQLDTTSPKGSVGTVFYLPLLKGDRFEIAEKSNKILASDLERVPLLAYDQIAQVKEVSIVQSRNGTRFRRGPLNAKSPLTSKEVEEAVLFTAMAKRLDLATMLILQWHLGYSVSDLAETYDSANVLWDTYPGQSNVKLLNPRDGSVVALPPVASQVIGSWWAMCGGYHGSCVQLAELSEYVEFLEGPTNPFTRAGQRKPYITELNEAYNKIKVSQSHNTRPLVTQNTMAMFDGRWCILDGVVYLEEGDEVMPLYLADKSLVQPTGDKLLVTEKAWSEEWCREQRLQLVRS